MTCGRTFLLKGFKMAPNHKFPTLRLVIAQFSEVYVYDGKNWCLNLRQRGTLKKINFERWRRNYFEVYVSDQGVSNKPQISETSSKSSISKSIPLLNPSAFTCIICFWQKKLHTILRQNRGDLNGDNFGRDLASSLWCLCFGYVFFSILEPKGSDMVPKSWIHET